jgi:hypothetical protein
MVKITLGEKGRRLKYNLYGAGLLLLVMMMTCTVCRRIDWSALQRGEFEKEMLELESQVLLEHQPADQQAYKFIGLIGPRLRDRWLAGYLYSRAKGEGYFIGRIAPPEFRKAIEAQKALIDGGKPYDKRKIPKLRMAVEFKRLNCRLLVTEVEPPTALPTKQ